MAGITFGRFAMKGIWQVLNLADFEFQTDDITKWRLYLNLSLLPVVSDTATCLVALARPFSAAYLPTFALSSGV